MSDNLLSAESSSSPSPLQSRGRSLPLVFAFLTIIELVAAAYFWRGQQTAVDELASARKHASHAERNFKASRTAIDTIVSDLADKFSNPAGLQAQDMAATLTKVMASVQALATGTEDEAEVRHLEASVYVQFSSSYLALGYARFAVDTARKGTALYRALAAEHPDNEDMQSNVGLSLARLAEALQSSGDHAAALVADRESLELARALAAKVPGNRQFRTDVALALWRLASAGDNPRERLAEALMLLKNLQLAAMLTPDQELWIAMIEADFVKLP